MYFLEGYGYGYLNKKNKNKFIIHMCEYEMSYI